MMTSPATPSRPRQVTLASWLVIAASVMLVLSVFEQLGDLRSLESRTAIERFLSEPPWRDLGIGLESALAMVRTISMVAAGLATAAAILGYHALKRNRAARIGLSVLAVPLFLSGLVTGGFLASVVAASIAMLWLQPARGWFTGDASPTARATSPSAPSSGPPATRTRPTSPTAGTGPAQPQVPSIVAPQVPPPWQGYGTVQGMPPWPAVPAAERRPGALVAACSITWATSAVAFVVGGLLAFVLMIDTAGLVAEMQTQNPALFEQGVTEDTVRMAGWVASIVCLVWSASAATFAALAFRRVRWAWVGLLVSCVAIALLCLLGSLVSPSMAVPGALAVLTVALLVRPSVQRWFSRARPARDGMSP